MYEIYERLLEQNHVTTADVCKATGISQSTMSNWKKRRSNLSAKNTRLVADYFGVAVDYLFTGIKQDTMPSESDDEVIGIIEFIKKNPGYKNVFKLACGIRQEDLELTEKILEKITR